MFTNMAQVRAANSAINGHWFDKSTLRFFRSRVGRKLYRFKYFITSEKFSYDSERLFSIREVKKDGRIETVGEFQAYRTRSAAMAAIKRLRAEG